VAIDPRRFGPTRGELVFRLVCGLAGLALMAVVFWTHGIPEGPAFAEVGLFGGLFLGGTVVWSARRLILRLHP